ncbi:MAG TPA: hypothetical protein ENI85_19645, partial [Deltaproteobacteria bacterium]|nr:hypothetical protein [Deltaproteobacteria bacterium]
MKKIRTKGIPRFRATTSVLSMGVAIFALSAGGGGSAWAESEPTFSPYVGRDLPDRVFFGDTHLHTS